jgi:glutamate-1-semialdehyde 2,1-aminomutase
MLHLYQVAQRSGVAWERVALSFPPTAMPLGRTALAHPLWLIAAALMAVLAASWAARRLLLLSLTLRARSFTPVFSRLLARIVKSYDYSDGQFLRADGASEAVVETRQRALAQLASALDARSSRARDWAGRIRAGFSDLRFTDANRVPFPFARVMRERFNLCSVVTKSQGPKLRDLDGNWNLDVSGSYGLNVAGFDRYKQWISRGWEQVKDLGPVLGPLHPVVAENIELLKSISGLDEVSFHMSGTEAVMAAVRVARFNTRRKFIVCFAGAYHGWWDGVQPGLGSERTLGDCLTLKEMHDASLALIRGRAHEIAGVLINPVQSFHPNSPPPSDAVLLTSNIRKAQDSKSAYAQWLRKLRQLCDECDIPLIFDEVFSGFRLARGGAQEYFGVSADIVIYGKTVAGGMPIGLVCGRQRLMRRFDPSHPMRIAYVVGTFSAHPLVMGAMNQFLHWGNEPATARLYAEASVRCATWASATNEQLAKLDLPVKVMNLATIWTVLFTRPGRYNWLLQYYLRAEGLTLSWVGTGRCMCSLDYSTEDYQELQDKIVNAMQKMRRDGWWLDAAPERERAMRWGLLREIAGSILRTPQPIVDFCREIMQRKHDDHKASHSNLINQSIHVLSSTTFVFCYVWIFFNLTQAMLLGLGSLFIRQFGHAILEPPCHDKEKALLGFNTRNKTLIVGGYLMVLMVHLVVGRATNFAALKAVLPAIAWQWFLWTCAVVLGRVLYLCWRFDFRTSMVWFLKLVTDPFTDLPAYYTSMLRLIAWPTSAARRAA